MGSLATRREAIRNLVSDLVKDGAEVKDSGRIKSVLIDSSFDRAKVLEFPDGIVGIPVRIDFDAKLDLGRWNFWWRTMCWWTNGKTLGLFTRKTEDGAWLAGWLAITTIWTRRGSVHHPRR